MSKLSIEAKVQMWEDLEALQDTFPYTVDGLLLFAQECISELIPGHPTLNRNQADMLDYMLTGHKYRMVQAQRGQAKTTLAGIFAAFVLIHKPHFRIVIFSQTSKRATEVSGWVVKIFKRMPFLQFMLPDKIAGDKDSTEAFDVHNVFKGGDKSPSVSSYSITSGAQGARADLLIPDDIESLQNSRTTSGREWLEEQAKEFESINQMGDILYLGTLQSTESIYNNLPARGYDVRVWPGRYPTEDEVKAYGDTLAPMFVQDMENNASLRTGYGVDGRAGAPTCPTMFDDELLTEKEVSQGKPKFMLQFMLNPALTDQLRYPIKPCNLIVAAFGAQKGMVMPIWNNAPENRVQTPYKPGSRDTDRFYAPIPSPYDWEAFSKRVMYIDGAGGGASGDETAYAVVFQLGNMLYLYDVGGVPGGYDEENLKELVQVAKRAGVHEVYVEKNYGHGAHKAILKPLFEQEHPCTLEDDFNKGQKEVRIIDTLEPLISAHRLVVNRDLIEKDSESTKRYPVEKRKTYSLFHQMSHITYARDCLKHDDRMDALAGACSVLVGGIDYDYSNKLNKEARRKALEMQEIMKDPRKRREYLGVETHGIPTGNNQFSSKTRSSMRSW